VKLIVATSNHAGFRSSLEVLQEGAAAAGGLVKTRLEEVRAVVSDDMVVVERGLARLVREGLSPATESATHLFEAGGKRVRPLTVLLSAACFSTPPEAVREVAVAAELVHLATLLHDDVVDDGMERRGRPAPRRIWGNAASVLAGDLLLTHALELTAAAAPPAVLRDLFATLRRLVDGEVVQLRGRTALDTSEAVYFAIVRDKTASLFEWAARAGAVCANAPPRAANALADYGAKVGQAFQLIDDVLDYAGDPRTTGKALLTDLVEGKLTLPLIRALASGSAVTADVDAVRAGDERAALRVAEAVRASGSCEEVRSLARQLTVQARASLEEVPDAPAREILSTIANDLALRTA
jgi:octaprenyl-diphosphate synthase